MCLIITRGLYIFCPIFHYSFYCRAFNISWFFFHPSCNKKKDSRLLFYCTYYLTQYFCGLYCRAVSITKKNSELQNPWFIIKRVFKSRASYNGACTVYIIKQILCQSVCLFPDFYFYFWPNNMKLNRPEAQENYLLICSSLAPVFTPQSQFYIQLVYKAFLCFMYTHDLNLSGCLFWSKTKFKKKKKNERDIMQLFSADTTMFKKITFKSGF